MKKGLLLSLLNFLIVFGLSAQKEWNFSDFTIETFSSDQTIDGLTIKATDKASVAIDANPKKNGTYAFTQRLKLGGTGVFSESVAVGRVLVFDVSGPTDITVAVLSSDSKTDRKLALAIGSEVLTEFSALGTYSQDGNNIPVETYSYTGEAATLYLYSPLSGVNIYLLKTEASGTSFIDTPSTEKGAPISIDYYNTVGQKVNENYNGILIKRSTFADGSVETQKIIIQ